MTLFWIPKLSLPFSLFVTREEYIKQLEGMIEEAEYESLIVSADYIDTFKKLVSEEGPPKKNVYMSQIWEYKGTTRFVCLMTDGRLMICHSSTGVIDEMVSSPTPVQVFNPYEHINAQTEVLKSVFAKAKEFMEGYDK